MYDNMIISRWLGATSIFALPGEESCLVEKTSRRFNLVIRSKRDDLIIPRKIFQCWYGRRGRECVHAQSCPTLCDSMDYNSPGSSAHGILQARKIGESSHSLLQGIFPIQGLNPHFLCLLHCVWILYYCSIEAWKKSWTRKKVVSLGLNHH